MVIVPPYPFTLQDPLDVPIGDCWYARPQLFFTCHVRPKHGRQPTRTNYIHCPDDILLELLFFSTFESLDLHMDCPMERAGVQKLYEPTPTPILFVAPCQNVRGRVPLFPLFLNGNVTPTIPFLYRQHQRTKFPHGITDSSNATGRKGSNVYEVNLWLWQFGRGKPRLGGLSVADTEDRRTELLKDGHRRAVETRKRRKARKAAK